MRAWQNIRVGDTEIGLITANTIKGEGSLRKSQRIPKKGI